MKGPLLRFLKPGHGVPKGKHPLRRAALRLAAVAALYAAASAVLAVAGAVPAAPVLGGMDIDNYYAWQILFVGPLVLSAWVLASGILLALGKKGARRSAVLVETARAWGGALAVAWVPLAVQAAFMALGMGQREWVDILSEPGLWQTAYLLVLAAAGASAVVRLVLAARATVHKKSWTAAVLTGLAAAAPAVGAYVLFIR